MSDPLDIAGPVAPAERRPSQDLTPSIHEAFAIAAEEVAPVARATRLQWGVIGTLVGALAIFLSWAFIDLIGIHTANAQTSVDAKQAQKTADEAKAGLAEVGQRLGVVERTTIRLETMQEMLLRAQGITPPPKVDAGQDAGR